MTVATKTICIQTMANGGMVDLTSPVQDCVLESGAKEGSVLVFCPGSTGAISTVEYEPGLEKDIPAALERIAPRKGEYAHHETWNDDNGAGHVRATIIGPSLMVPVSGGRVLLGQWQQIVFIECDTRDRKRDIIVQVSW